MKPSQTENEGGAGGYMEAGRAFSDEALKSCQALDEWIMKPTLIVES